MFTRLPTNTDLSRVCQIRSLHTIFLRRSKTFPTVVDSFAMRTQLCPTPTRGAPRVVLRTSTLTKTPTSVHTAHATRFWTTSTDKGFTLGTILDQFLTIAEVLRRMKLAEAFYTSTCTQFYLFPWHLGSFHLPSNWDAVLHLTCNMWKIWFFFT